MSDTTTYDLSERDPEFIRQTLPVVRLYTDLWHRSDVRGLKHLKGVAGALLVGNHSGGLATPDAPIVALAIMKRYGVGRPVFLLAHDVLFWAPGTSALRKWGIMPASRANAIAAMRQGGAVIVFPGGDREVFRPTSEQGKVDLAGRHGFVDTALRAGVPIVPFVSIGGQETQWFLSRGEWLGRFNPLRDWLRSTMWPLSFGFPFGLSIGGFPPNLIARHSSSRAGWSVACLLPDSSSAPPCIPPKSFHRRLCFGAATAISMRPAWACSKPTVRAT